MKIDIPHHLSDEELEAQLKALARGEQEATARLISRLAEFDARRLYLPAGFSSLFNYCCEVLRLSEPAAYNRIEVARAARRFPDILQMLGEGSLGLATVRLLAPQLTADNSEQLFAAAAGKTKREVEQMLGGRFPRPDVPTLGPQAAGGSFAPYAAGSLRAAGCEHGGGPALGQSVVGALTGAGETPDRQAARYGPLRDPVHRHRRDPREATAGPGPPPPRRSDRRRCASDRSRAYTAHRRPEAQEDRGDGSAADQPRYGPGPPRCRGQGSADGLEP